MEFQSHPKPRGLRVCGAKTVPLARGQGNCIYICI